MPARALTWTERRAWLDCRECGRPARHRRPRLQAWPWARRWQVLLARLVNRLTWWGCLECAVRRAMPPRAPFESLELHRDGAVTRPRRPGGFLP